MKKILLMIVLGVLFLDLYAPQNGVVSIGRCSPIQYVSINDVKDMLIEFKVQHYKIVLAQIRLESGNLTSFLCRENKNLLGMKFPVRRKTTAIGSDHGYAVYDNYRDCIKDMVLWQESSYKKGNNGDYILHLIDVYAEDPNYIKKLMELI